METYEIWTESGHGMWHPERWGGYNTKIEPSEKLMLPKAWARALAKELNARTGQCTEVRGTRAWQTVYARFGAIQESYGSIDDDMEGIR